MKRDIAGPNQPSFRENGRYIARRIVPAASSLTAIFHTPNQRRMA